MEELINGDDIMEEKIKTTMLDIQRNFNYLLYSNVFGTSFV